MLQTCVDTTYIRVPDEYSYLYKLNSINTVVSKRYQYRLKCPKECTDLLLLAALFFLGDIGDIDHIHVYGAGRKQGLRQRARSIPAS